MTSGGFHDFDWEGRALRRRYAPRSLWERWPLVVCGVLLAPLVVACATRLL